MTVETAMAGARVAVSSRPISPSAAPNDRARDRPTLQGAVARAALGVLVIANFVGLWLAALLLWPSLGQLTGPLTYGRWVPLHLDLQLFGWCSLPVIGLLFARFLPRSSETQTPLPASISPGRLEAGATLALAAWCGALAAGALAWLGGHTSGKIFLDWTGPAGLAFAGAQLVLWSVLAAGWWTRVRNASLSPSSWHPQGYTARWQAGLDALLLLVLLAVPFALYFAAQPGVYPPINPHSGGATGHSLLASSLGIIGLALALPALLGRPAAQPGNMRRAALGVLIGFAANWGVYLLIEHGNASHRQSGQIVGLATLLVWPMWLAWWFRKFRWEQAHRRWLLTAAAWAALLVLDGFALFLPGALERAKFTNALVAHSHLAMAGLLTSLNLLMLISLAPLSRLARSLAARGPWLAWNVACLAMIAALTLLGWREGVTPRLIADGNTLVTAGYLARFAAGAVMLAASGWWLAAARDPAIET